ncbi:DUF397 domain-containing protein [Micromonospora sp. DT44]|uniref:DUF397 domain-containing protein n=1 Tax=Micromonospora sp. DT44 TaxID=3393439 RepID=UPI003CEB4C20
MDLTSAQWRKSTKSGNNGGACVEVAGNLPEIVAIRDSKDQHGPALVVGRNQWQAFVAIVKTDALS